ncbi:hypothetical protein HNP40_001406 [Mycobacteroides chelonae]|nr:hypothetical protein [Mycobacteroides chelonae]
MSAGLRRTLAVTAMAAVVIGGVKVTSDYTAPGSGFSTIATGAADPTGPTGGPSGPGGMNGGQFQPPGLPPQQPNYQGGVNQPPLDQNSGISIYNTGAQGVPQQPGQQGAQQADQGLQPQHGTQIPDYQTATPYTQGPGRANPDYQGPQQNSPQQPQTGNQQQPQTQAPTQTQAPDQDQDNSDQQQRCKDGSMPGQPLSLSLAGLDKLPSQIASMMQQAIQMRQSTGRANITSQSDSKQNRDGSSTSTSVSVVDNPLISWAGLFVPALDGKQPEILINLAKLSGNQEADTALVAHEIGHGMALPDTASGQIMDHDGMTRALSPTPADVESLQQIQNLTCTQGPQALKEVSEGCPPMVSGDNCKFWNLMTPEEQSVCEARPTVCLLSVMAHDKDIATWRSLQAFKDDPRVLKDELGKPVTEDNIVNAAQHCMWQGLLAQTLGPFYRDFAADMGDAHEIGNFRDPIRSKYQTPESSIMDLLNNAVGRSVGASHLLDREAVIQECISLANSAQVIPRTTAALSNVQPGKLVYFG